MPATPFHVMVRRATNGELDNLGRLFVEAFASDSVVRMLYAQADPDALRKWYWMGGAKETVEQGTGTVIVAEQEGTGDVVGLAWFVKMNQSNPPGVPASFPAGYNLRESAKMRGPRHKWQNDLLNRYGEYLYLDSIAVRPDFQGHGYGSRLMSAVIEEAEKGGHNVALCASEGKGSFYTKFGFQKVEEPVMLCEGQLEGVRQGPGGIISKVARS